MGREGGAALQHCTMGVVRKTKVTTCNRSTVSLHSGSRIFRESGENGKQFLFFFGGESGVCAVSLYTRIIHFRGYCALLVAGG